MKKNLMALIFIFTSSLAYADLAQDLQKECESEEIKEMIKTNGSCRVVVASKKIEDYGYCVGVFMGQMPCIVKYVSVPEGAAMNLTCGNDLKKPDVNEDLSAEASGYNVAYVIKKDNGEDVIKNDPNEYQAYSSTFLNLKLKTSEEGRISKTTGSIDIRIEQGIVALTNVTCN